MKRTTLVCITSALLAFATPALTADTTTNEAPATVHHEGKRGDNRAFLHAIGLTAADLKGLSKEDRRSKIESAAESTEAALKQKETAGTITDQEKTDLAMIEKRLAHAKKNTNQ